MRKRTLASLLVAMCLSIPASGAAELTVSAAVSLKEAFTELGNLFQSQHAGDKVIFNFGSSGELSQQIERGAPVDLFASASTAEMKKLVTDGLVDKATVIPFAKNKLVVIVPKPGRELKSLAELADMKRIAIGNPKTVPAGEYAVEALSKAQIYAPLIVAQKLVFGENVRQVLDYVQTDNVDAGIVYSTDARIGKNIKTGFEVPEGYTMPIEYPIAIVKNSKLKELAEKFEQLVVSRQGQSILESKGFIREDK